MVASLGVSLAAGAPAPHLLLVFGYAAVLDALELGRDRVVCRMPRT